MIVREIVSFVILGFFPVFEAVCYAMLQRKKNDIMMKKRNVFMIQISTIAAWLAYINLINSIFGGIYCGLYHIFVILLTPLSVGPQILRGIRLWGMLEHNKALVESFGGHEEYLNGRFGKTSGEEGENSLDIIYEANSSKEEHSQLSDVHIHVNQRNSTKGKVREIKANVIRFIGLTRLVLIVLPFILVLTLLVMTEPEKLTEREFEKCFPEPPFILNAGRSLSVIFSFTAFCTTIFMSRCHDELGIHMEIMRNIAILFVTNLLGFVFRYLDYIEWQAFIYIVQQILLSFSMIILPCMDNDSLVSWMKSKSKRLIPGARPLPQLPLTRGSMLLPGKKMSQIEMKENNIRTRELTMSLDAGLCILLSSSEGTEAFTEHCSREFSVENIKFWLEVNEFHKAIDVLRDVEEKSNHDENDILTFAKEIFQTFIEDNSPMQINISEAQSNSIRQTLESSNVINRDLFDNAQKEIYALMSRHSYPRFLVSKSNVNYKARVEASRRAKKSLRRGSTIIPN